MTALDDLDALPRWIAWRNEARNGKATKVPYAPQGGKAKADDSSTWGTREAAEGQAAKIANGSGGGIGVQLGEFDDGNFLGGIGLDSFIPQDGTTPPWAALIPAAKTQKSGAGNGLDNSRSARAFGIGLKSRRAGKSFEQFCEAVRTDPVTATWYVEKGAPGDLRELRRIWEKTAANVKRGLD